MSGCLPDAPPSAVPLASIPRVSGLERILRAGRLRSRAAGTPTIVSVTTARTGSSG